MDIHDFLIPPADSTRRKGPYDRIVMSSRVRLARNLKEAAFPGWAKKPERVRVLELIRPAVESLPDMKDAFSETMDSLSTLDKQILVERHLISRELSGAKGGAGVIINVSSQMGHVGSERDRTVYVMTKHAVEGLTKAMAVELAPKGVRVVSIAPTFVATPLSKPFLDDPDTRKWILGRIPLGRVGTVEEVASAVVFLASPAAALVTGSSLLVDGGWTAW